MPPPPLPPPPLAPPTPTFDGRGQLAVDLGDPESPPVAESGLRGHGHLDVRPLLPIRFYFQVNCDDGRGRRGCLGVPGGCGRWVVWAYRGVSDGCLKLK